MNILNQKYPEIFSTHLLRVVVLQTDLEVHSLGELPLLVSAGLQHSSDTLVELISGDLTHLGFCKVNIMI